MLPSHALNHGTKTNAIEPALVEMREAMFGGKLTIAGHNTELLEEMRNYHRDEDFKIVKQLDDLISALRYAIASRRHGQAAVGLRGHRLRGPALCTAASSAQSTALAICPRTPNHADGGIDPFTGT